MSNLYCYLPLSWKICNGSFNSSTTVACSSNVLTKYPMLYVQFWAPDDGRRNRLKHVEHFTEISSVPLHLVGYTWKYFYDARAHGRQICRCLWTSTVSGSKAGCTLHIFDIISPKLGSLYMTLMQSRYQLAIIFWWLQCLLPEVIWQRMACVAKFTTQGNRYMTLFKSGSSSKCHNLKTSYKVLVSRQRTPTKRRFVRDFKVPSRSKLDMRCFGTLCNVRMLVRYRRFGTSCRSRFPKYR